MSTLFLIGNGCDINCGMKTRYTDVYKGYINENAATENLKKFKETISSDIENWGDFEMAMARYAGGLRNEAELLECVRDFAKYMERHLLKELNDFKKKLSNEQIYNAVLKEVADSFSSFYLGISHNVNEIMESRNVMRISNMEAISFNYTDAFDVVFAEYVTSFRFNKKTVIHVHGRLQDDPVFGIDNVEQIRTSYSLSRKGKRGFIKPVFNEEYDRLRVQMAKARIENADTICIYGMSLGDSDLSWRNEIVEWLRKNEGHHLFIYKYSLSDAEYRTAGEKMDIEDDEKEHLLSEWGINNDDAIYEQIHIPCGKNIFNIEKVIEAEEIKQENYRKKKAELKERLEPGRGFVEQSLHEAEYV